MVNPAPHRTPLRRVSQGSLFALSRSTTHPEAPHGLGFIGPAMAEFVDETHALQTNVEGLNNLSSSLATFNESFASWLYIMNMNALTTEWPQAPTDGSVERAEKRAAEEALAAFEAAQRATAATKAAAAARQADLTAVEGDTTYGNTTTTVSKFGLTKKKVAKPKMSAKEKKERGIEVERIITCLPLEFRGGDPNLRRYMESVISGLIDAPNQALRLQDLLAPPDLNQARVNKCLIALVNRKIVRKDSSTGTVLYHWRGVP